MGYKVDSVNMLQMLFVTHIPARMGLAVRKISLDGVLPLKGGLRLKRQKL